MPSYIFIGFAVSLVVCLLLLLTKHWHGHFSMDHTHGVQKFHTKPTPRIGGIGIAAGLIAAWAMSPIPVAKLLGPLLIAGIPAFVVGLLEDATKKVGAVHRLLATMLSGAIACSLTGIALDRVGVPPVTELLTYGPIAVAFTVFAVAGVANSINIIDGFNGLASGTSLIILLALGTIASIHGDTPLIQVCAVVGMAVLGFWAVNFPLGKLFLGDGGAYLVGFAIAWIAVLLLMRNLTISPWTVLLACGYPVIEVLYSVLRRWRDKVPAGAPDSLHLHSLVKTQVIVRLAPRWHVRLRNAAVSPLMWLYAAMPASLAVALEGSSTRWAHPAVFVACAMVYHLIYRYLAIRAQRFPLPDNDLAALTANANPSPADSQAAQSPSAPT